MIDALARMAMASQYVGDDNTQWRGFAARKFQNWYNSSSIERKAWRDRYELFAQI